jgi:hypothetical protein
VSPSADFRVEEFVGFGEEEVPDRHAFAADEQLLTTRRSMLTFRDGGNAGVGAQTDEEIFEPGAGLAVDDLGGERVELAAQLI